MKLPKLVSIPYPLLLPRTSSLQNQYPADDLTGRIKILGQKLLQFLAKQMMDKFLKD
jgi:hypothetical protein